MTLVLSQWKLRELQTISSSTALIKCFEAAGKSEIWTKNASTATPFQCFLQQLCTYVLGVTTVTTLPDWVAQKSRNSCLHHILSRSITFLDPTTKAVVCKKLSAGVCCIRGLQMSLFLSFASLDTLVPNTLLSLSTTTKLPESVILSATTSRSHFHLRSS